MINLKKMTQTHHLVDEFNNTITNVIVEFKNIQMTLDDFLTLKNHQIKNVMISGIYHDTHEEVAIICDTDGLTFYSEFGPSIREYKVA